jgi:hypothetical protein
VKLAAIILLCGMSGLWAQTDPALREEGVLYLEGNVPDKAMAKIKAPTTLYLHRDFQMVLAVLNPGQEVEIVGSGAEGYLVKGTARNNAVMGWIHQADLPAGFDRGVFTKAKRAEEWRAAVAVAIANKNVIRGMTSDEVEKAVGHPTQTASRTDAHGSELTWIFTTYREEPQYTYSFDAFGRPILQTYYVKIPVGQMVVNFAGGVVDTIEQHETNPQTANY